MGPSASSAFDADRGDATRVAPVLQNHCKSATRFVATRRGREVFEVDNQRIGATANHRVVGIGVGAGTEEPGPPQVAVGRPAHNDRLT